jgi:LmbE family N-acetylglucosaminyl deacetylase
MLPLCFRDLRSILCLGAHADDLEIGCGGTILRALSENPGLRVHWVVFSAAGPRSSEAQASAERFLQKAGERQIVIGEFRDSFFPYDGAAIKEFMHELGRQARPDLVLTHGKGDLHQDHRLLAELTWNVFRNQVILEYEIPKYEGDLGHPNLYVPLQESVCREKIDALCSAFPTQLEKPWFTPDTFWALLRLRGVECHSPSHFAEAFTCRKLVW